MKDKEMKKIINSSLDKMVQAPDATFMGVPMNPNWKLKLSLAAKRRSDKRWEEGLKNA